jgi:DDRGK domain-containing protein 1
LNLQDKKVVILEDLAVRFKLKIHAAINRIEQLQEDKILTGVFDDRGKFIFLSTSELEAVAKFIRQRGRVSIADLAAASNNLINLTPVNAAA